MNLRRSSRARFILLIALLAAVPSSILANRLSQGTATLEGRGEMWKHDSFCGFPFPANLPTRESRAANTSITRSTCAYMEEHFKAAGLQAVLLRWVNSGTSPSEIPVAGLGSVRLSDSGGRTLNPVAMLWPIRSDRPTFVTQMSGTWAAVVPPGQTVDLVFLFSAARVGDKVAVGSLRPVAIR